MEVICTVVLILTNGYHDVEQLRGTVVKEGTRKNPPMEVLYVDFSKVLKKRLPEFDGSITLVQKLNENDCLYIKDPVIK